VRAAKNLAVVQGQITFREKAEARRERRERREERRREKRRRAARQKARADASFGGPPRRKRE
jgi:hypothetical protein